MAEAAKLRIDAEYMPDLKNIASNVESLLSQAEAVASKHKIKIDIDKSYLQGQVNDFMKTLNSMGVANMQGVNGGTSKAKSSTKQSTKKAVAGAVNDYKKALSQYRTEIMRAEKANMGVGLFNDKRSKSTGTMWRALDKNDKDAVKQAKHLQNLSKNVAEQEKLAIRSGYANDKIIAQERERLDAVEARYNNSKAIKAQQASLKQSQKDLKDYWNFRTNIEKEYAKGNTDVYYDKKEKTFKGSKTETVKRGIELEAKRQAAVNKTGKALENFAKIEAFDSEMEQKYRIEMEKQIPSLEMIQKSRMETEEFLKNSQASRLGTTSANNKALRENVELYKELEKNYGEKSAGQIGKQYNDITKSVEENKSAIISAGEATSSFSGRLGAAFKKYAQYFGVSRAIMAGVRGIKMMASASMEVESAMNRIQIVTGASDKEMKSFFNVAAKQAGDLGQSITDVAGSIETFSRLGYNLEDASNLSRYATIMSNVAATDVGSATTGITSIIKGYSMQASDAEHVSDVLVNVGQKYAISAEELMVAFERGGAALAASGTDFEKSAALFAATNASLQNAQTTGTMWKTVSARIRGAKTELEEMGEDTSDLAEGFSKNRDELMALTGVDIMKNEKEYKDLYDIFTELAAVWDNINGDAAKARVAEILGGTRQLSGIMSTITNIKDAQGAYEAAMNSAGVSARANDKYMETTAAHVGKLKATFQEFSADFMRSDFLTGIVDTGNVALKVVDKLIGQFGVMKTLIGAFAGAKLLSPIMSSIPELIKNLSKLPTVFKAVSEGAAVKDAIGGLIIPESMSTGVTQLVGSLKSMLPVLGAVAGAFVAFKAFDWLNSSWTRYQERAKNSVNEYKEAQAELESLESQRTSQLTQAKDMAAKYDIDVSGVEKVDQVIDKINSSDKGITLVDQAELDKLSSANSQLEATLALQKEAADAKKQSALMQTESASKVEKSYWEQLKEQFGSGLFGTMQALGAYYADYKTGSSARKEFEGDDTTNIGLAETSLKNLTDLKKEQRDLEKVVSSGKATKKQKKRYEELASSIAEASVQTANYVEAVSAEAEVLAESDTDYAQNYKKRAQQIMKGFRQIDMSKSEKYLDNMQTFFSTENGKRIEKFLKKNAKSTTQLGNALASLGLSTQDLGIANIGQLKKYLDETAKAASNASNSTTDFRKNVSDIEAATESANQDKNWNTVQAAYQQAKDLLKEGKTGTDDFQVMAQFLSPKNLEKAAKAAADAGGYAADEYQKAFQDVMKTADRWFGEDETKSMENFVKDFQSKGLFDVRTDDMGLWDIKTNFDTTAEAAKEFGMSVGAVETMLSSLEAYGYDFSGIQKSGEMLSSYTSSLDKLKELRDSMDDGSGKSFLDRMIEGFDSEYATFKDDLTKLDETQVVRIEFEYDLATIQADIDGLKEKLKWGGASGEQGVQNYAALLSSQQEYLDKAYEYTGLSREGMNQGKFFTDTFGTVERLQSELQKAVSSGDTEAIIDVQARLSNVHDMEQDLVNKFREVHPEITPESNLSDVQAAWNSFIQTSADGKTITVNAEMNDEEVRNFLESEGNEDKTIRFTAKLDGEDKIIQATKDKDGHIKYTTTIDGMPQEVDLNKDGTVTLHTKGKEDVDALKQSEDQVKDKQAVVKAIANGEGGVRTLRQEIRDINSKSVTVKATTSGTGALSAMQSAIAAIKSKTVSIKANTYFSQSRSTGAQKAAGTAHAMGTAFVNGNRRGDWRAGDSGWALGGELGEEMVVRDGRWFTIGGNGAEFFKYRRNDIIFNADQTEQLFKNGRIVAGQKRGSALAEGTAFRLGGSSSSYKKTGRSSGGTGGGGGSSSQKTDSVLDKFKDWLATLFDWVEVRLERVSTRIDDAAQRAERAASAGNLSAAVSNYNQAISLSKTHLSNVQSGKAKYDAQAEKVLTQAVSRGLINQSTANSIFGRDADGTIDISEYSERVQEVVSAYMAWKDKARDAADEIETIAEDITGYYKSIAETYKEIRENEISLVRQQSDNTETAAGKNSLLESIASKYDDITSKIKAAYSNVDSIAKSNASTLSGANINNNMTSTLTKYNNGLKNTVKSYMQSAIDAAKAGKPISGDVLSTLTEYHRYGYISSSFYAACVQYNNALDAKEDLQGQLEIAKETAKQEKIALGTEMVDNISKELQRKFDKFEASKDLIESRQKTNKTIGYDLNASDYNTLIDYSRQQQALLTEEKRAIDAAIARNLALGLWNTSTPEYIEKQIEVEELASKIQDCVTAQEEYNNAIMQLPYDTIEHALSLLDAIASYNESISDLKEAEGVDRLESDYLTQIEDNSNKIEEYLKKRIQAYADYERALANGGAIGGKRAEEYLELYYEANTEINKLKEANEELKDSLRDDVWWRTFDRAHEAAQRLLDVVSGIADLISDDMYFKDGALSEFGIAQVANLTKQYELARQEIENYSNDILNLNDLYTDGYYTTEEYKEKLGELQVELLNSAKDMKGYLEEIMSMYKEIDEQELKALLSLIDKRRDALKSKKDYYDYDKTIRGKTKDIKELTAQIAALEGITTAEAKAQKAKLQAQLQEAQEDLEKTQTEHHFDLLNKGLDELKDTFQNEFDEKWENLAGDLAKMAELLTAANELATQNTEQVINTLNNLLSFYGIDSARTKIDQAFASGTKRVKGNIVGLSNESGSELLVTKHGIVSHFKPGEGVVPPDLTARLFNLAQQVKPNTALGKANINGLTSGVGASITQNYGSLINIEGSADAATVADLKRMSKDLLEKSYNYTSKRMTHDYVRTGGLRRA